MTSSFHINNKKKDILIAGIGSKQGLDDTTLTAEVKYLINFSNKRSDKICISKILYKIYHFKAKDSDTYTLCLGNISGDFSANTIFLLIIGLSILVILSISTCI